LPGLVNERRRMMVDVYVRTWSLKTVVKVVSERFHVSEAALRIDWNRRHTWPKEVFDHISCPGLIDFYLVGIHRTLRQIEKELTRNTNHSCRVGLLKAKTEVLFKLIEVQQSIVNQEVLMKRLEKLEEKLRLPESNSQDDRTR
jgi:hypothetical protein